jgi:hypothetical protein
LTLIGHSGLERLADYQECRPSALHPGVPIGEFRVYSAIRAAVNEGALMRHVQRLFILAVLATVYLFAAGSAFAGYGVQPNGQTIQVTTDSFGYINSPSSIGMLVYLDSGDSNPYVWVSDQPTLGAYGMPAGDLVGSCGPYEFQPWTEQNKYTCNVDPILMKAGVTYYWWLDFDKQEPGDLFPTQHISGPFSFTLALAPAAPTPTSTPPTTTPPSTSNPTSTSNVMTAESATTLPSSDRYDGTRSVEGTKIGQLIYKTMKLASPRPRVISVACWDPVDFESVAEGEGETVSTASTTLEGLFLPRMPRWVHLGADTCKRVQNLFNTKAASAQNGYGLMTALHEASHAYGVTNEAQANCYAVQLVPYAANLAGMPWKRAQYLGKLTLNLTRRTSPAGYWNSSRCTDYGDWDLVPSLQNLR